MTQTANRSPWTANRRAPLLAEWAEAARAFEALQFGLERVPEEARAAARHDLDAARDRLAAAQDAYADALPRVPLSRCPFSGAPVFLAIDTLGLDGPWWDARNPVRPIEPLPSTVFAWTGALHLGDPPPATPFLCKPGPEAPFVVPRLVADPRIRAVVSRLEVGGRPAFLIVYFARTTPFELIRANAWGTDLYFARDDRGAGYAGRCLPSDLDYDFDLVPWIRAGRVLWITPGDPTLTLRATVADCPFLGLPGRRYPLALEDGDVWDDLPAETAHG